MCQLNDQNQRQRQCLLLAKTKIALNANQFKSCNIISRIHIVTHKHIRLQREKNCHVRKCLTRFEKRKKRSEKKNRSRLRDKKTSECEIGSRTIKWNDLKCESLDALLSQYLDRDATHSLLPSFHTFIFSWSFWDKFEEKNTFGVDKNVIDVQWKNS